jgi:hypothetical protein
MTVTGGTKEGPDTRPGSNIISYRGLSLRVFEKRQMSSLETVADFLLFINRRHLVLHHQKRQSFQTTKLHTHSDKAKNAAKK